jgi:hypothetical protein
MLWEGDQTGGSVQSAERRFDVVGWNGDGRGMRTF